jgi:hypothetical protein
MESSHRAHQIHLFERDADMLAVYQLDLLAQVERQVRAVHHTMRHIEKLRSARTRVGPELSNGQRDEVLVSLADEITALDAQWSVEHASCLEMQTTIAKMHQRLVALRRRASGDTLSLTDSLEPGAES